MSEIEEIDIDGTYLLVREGRVLLLDVREDDEWAAGHASLARHIPLGDLAGDELREHRPIITVCRSGRRSLSAAETLQAAGHSVRSLRGGMQAWQQAGHDVVTETGRPGTVV